MFPTPFVNFIPKGIVKQGQAAMTALCTEADRQLALLIADIINLRYLKDPSRCPSSLLDQLGNYINAGLVNTDSTAIKRKKIYEAVETHKRRGSWTLDIKPSMDAVTGFSASIFTIAPINDYIFCHTGTETATWAEFGHTGSDGIAILEATPSIWVGPVGELYINCGCSGTLTAAQVAVLYALLLDKVPAYYRTHIGYTTATETYVTYSGGIIG